jgi:hypothetical protein
MAYRNAISVILTAVNGEVGKGAILKQNLYVLPELS